MKCKYMFMFSLKNLARKGLILKHEARMAQSHSESWIQLFN